MPRSPAPDLVDELVRDGERRGPGFAARVEDALDRRVLGRALAARRESLGLTQGEVARRMRTSPPAVRRIEAGADVRLSTLARYLHVVGVSSDWPQRLARA